MQVMIDLETLSTSNNAQIISIGAVKFDSSGIHDEFYQNIKLKDVSEFDISGKTVLWWLSQPKEAQEALLEDSLNLKDSLIKFNSWFKTTIVGTLTPSNGGKEVWGNGATFDNVILRNAYNRLGLECPWSFRDDRCFRTMARVLEAEIERRGHTKAFEFKGQKHNALDDARNQAEYLIWLCNMNGEILLK